MSYNSKISAVLGNGPSRKLYDKSKVYNFLIGSNIPWTRVDATVILDEEVIRLWAKNKDLISCPVLFSKQSWMMASEVGISKWVLDNNYFIDMISRETEFSSGIYGCIHLIEKGYKDIDIYGCDAYFTDNHDKNLESYSREFLPQPAANNSSRWKRFWDDLIAKHPDVKFNFIKE
jgi:hypothetical protein